MLTRFNGVVFFPSYQHQLFYLFYPKYVFLSFTSLYLTFLNNFILQIYENFPKEVSPLWYKKSKYLTYFNI
jgi:hypothetical protein